MCFSVEHRALLNGEKSNSIFSNVWWNKLDWGNFVMKCLPSPTLLERVWPCLLAAPGGPCTVWSASAEPNCPLSRKTFYLFAPLHVARRRAAASRRFPPRLADLPQWQALLQCFPRVARCLVRGLHFSERTKMYAKFRFLYRTWQDWKNKIYWWFEILKNIAWQS